MEQQGSTPGSDPQDTPPSSGQQMPPSQYPAAGQPPHPPPYPPPYAPPYPPAGTPTPRSSGAWKWFLGAFIVLTLATIACCGIIVASAGVSGDTSMTFGESIALIHLDSVIVGVGDSYITPEVFISKLNRAEEDPNVKALLIRVDSPGGTVAASQEIAMVLAEFSKPVIISIGDVGASGAYMIASQADLIIATPTSAVGSIGVISEIPNVSGLLEKIGVEFTTLTAGEYKDTGSMYRSLSPSETAMIQVEIDFAYDEFIRMVAEGRDLPESEVREMATGWAWSGTEAMEMGLVDELGTINDAMARTAELGDIEGSYEIVEYDYYDYTDFLYGLVGIKDSLDRLSKMDPTADAAGPVIPR